MRHVGNETVVPLWKAAELLDVEVEEVFDLVVAGELKVVRRPNGRPLVTLAEIERFRSDQAAVRR